MQKKLFLGATALVFGLAAGDAFAGGYQINEFSGTNLGRAFAGSGVVGDDLSAIAFNPAGMTLNGTGLQAGISWIELRSKARGHLSTGKSEPIGDVDLIKTLPSIFGQYKVNDKFVVGFGAYTPFGLATEYNRDWFGATHGTKTELVVFDIAGGIAVKPMKELSFGATAVVRYVSGDLINQVGIRGTPYASGIPGSSNEMDMDGWGAGGYNFGVMYEPTEYLRFGLSYRVQSSNTVKGTQTIKGVPAIIPINGEYYAESTMTLPNQLLMTGYYKLNDKFALSGMARWVEWSVFDDFVMLAKGPSGDIVIPEKWKDSWTFSFGVDYFLNEHWTLRGGVSYDQTPVRNSQYRTARIPDSDRYWVTLGFSYKWEKLKLDVGYAHLFMAKSSSDNYDKATGTTIHTDYEGRGNMIGVSMQYLF